jgi:hypothetical protein
MFSLGEVQPGRCLSAFGGARGDQASMFIF